MAEQEVGVASLARPTLDTALAKKSTCKHPVLAGCRLRKPRGCALPLAPAWDLVHTGRMGLVLPARFLL